MQTFSWCRALSGGHRRKCSAQEGTHVWGTLVSLGRRTLTDHIYSGGTILIITHSYNHRNQFFDSVVVVPTVVYLTSVIKQVSFWHVLLVLVHHLNQPWSFDQKWLTWDALITSRVCNLQLMWLLWLACLACKLNLLSHGQCYTFPSVLWSTPNFRNW